MTSYTHTAADALALAATCEKRVSAGTGVALNPAATDMVAKALKFWAEHNKFKKGDKVVCVDGFDDDGVYVVSYPYTGSCVVLNGDLNYPACEFRLATTEEESAGYRIDEVQSD